MKTLGDDLQFVSLFDISDKFMVFGSLFFFPFFVGDLQVFGGG